MNQPLASTEALGPVALARPRTGRFVLWTLAAACAAAFLLAGASLLQWLTFAGACAFVHLASRQPSRPDAAARPQAAAAPSAVPAPEAAALPALLPAVLPVWQRHLQDVRVQTDTAATALATSLSNINHQFEEAGFKGAGSADGVVGHQQDTAISLLTLCERELLPVVSTMNMLVRDKGNVASGIHQLATATSELHDMAAGVRRIADQTNLLAINAAIQAAHAGAAGRGFGIVAKEIRNLAAVSAQTGHQIDKRVAQVSSVMKNTVQAAVDAAENDKLAIELSGRVVEDVLSHVRELSSDAERMREQGTVLRGEVEHLMVHLQFQDRVSQMLTAVDADMDRLATAVGTADALPPTDAWLARLEQSYTMESQRHGSERGTPDPGAVEFF